MLLLAGCGTDCAPVSSVGANGAQKAALEDAQKRNARRCATSEAKCQFLIEQREGREVWVRTNFIYADSDSGECIQAGDGVEDAVYDVNGKFIRIDPQ